MECASGWGKVTKKKWNVLLAGEMLNVFFFFFFENVLLTGVILKKLKMLKMGGAMFVHIRHQYKNMVPPILTFLTF